MSRRGRANILVQCDLQILCLMLKGKEVQDEIGLFAQCTEHGTFRRLFEDCDGLQILRNESVVGN